MAASGVQDKVWLGDYILQILNGPSWASPIEEYIGTNCVHFDLPDPEENRLEYTRLHAEFKNLIESLLAAHLLDVDVSPEEFAAEFAACCERDERLELVGAQLASAEDFLVFKRMMAARFRARFPAEAAAAAAATDGGESMGSSGAALLEPSAPAPCAGGGGAAEAASAIPPPPPAGPTAPPTAPPPVAVAPATAGAASQAEETSGGDGDVADALPPLLPASVRSGHKLELGKAASARIAAIVANTMLSKKDDKEKAALVSASGKSGSGLLLKASRYGA